MNDGVKLKLVTVDLVRSGVGSPLFIASGTAFWSRFIEPDNGDT